MARAPGFRPGWRVLDAGCGSGSYLAVLAQQTGDLGEVVAFDLDLENCLRAAETGGKRVVAASLAALPFAARAFDGLWCANTLQYVADEDLVGTLQEFRRLVRPGGVVAVKDTDVSAAIVRPAPPFLFQHLAEACAAGPRIESQGALRGRELRRRLESAGLVNVHQRAVFIERWAPLTDVESRFWREWLSFLARLPEVDQLSADERSFWAAIASDGGHAFVARPDFYGCEAQVVAWGETPDGSGDDGR